MSRNPFEILSFELLELRVRGVGPFQEDLFILDLTDKDNEPSNFYIMAGRNGRGKTTSIEAIAYLLGLLQPEQSRLPVGWGTRLAEGAALQLDLRVRVSQDGAERAMLLSLCAGAGEDPFLYEWPAERLERYAIQRTARYGYGTRPSGAPVWFGEGDPLILDLKAKVQGAADREPDPSPEGLAEDAPTVLYFTAYRDLGPPPPLLQRTLSPPDWRYRTLWRFEREGERWAGTLDNALVWLEYLAPERFERFRGLINERVFQGEFDDRKQLSRIRRAALEAVIVYQGREDHEHRIDQLSSGEKARLQLLLRLMLHSTRNTLVLIDEIEGHLHPSWERWTVGQLKRWAAENRGTTILFTSHSPEVIAEFRLDAEREGLRKSAWLIEEGFVGADLEDQG